jgi:hypothetical protein
MSLTLESGAGVAGADTYISLADADAYHAARGNTAWAAATQANREIALRNACAYLDATYRFKGTKYAKTNPLAWPRYGVTDCDGYEVDGDEIPDGLKKAQAELALRALAGALVTDTAATAYVKREKIDVLEVEYFGGQSRQSVYVFADRLLECYINGKAGSGFVELSLG